MMWNWVVSTLAIGAAVVLYDGSPLKPTPTVLWDLVDRLGTPSTARRWKWP
uniref:Acetoacetyl-CoA synthetase n=1 Tax=Rousettus aegyptiacus TaxID=9407 RepID=A0A7J8GUX8_ROUAE|nr:acetoacetyl-CoA synthetase [Rousettus aegyptiacus]